MVLKKTNCPAVNSGNSMRKRLYQQVFQRHVSQLTHVIKHRLNISMRDGRMQEVEVARTYVDDGNLASCCRVVFYTFPQYAELYSLNKKKRWLLKDVMTDAICGDFLSEESFKVSLVHRNIPHDCNKRALSIQCNVTYYCDNHLTTRIVTANGNAASTRLSLIQKGNKPQSVCVGKKHWHKVKRRQNHNQHSRGIQRKKIKASSQTNQPRETEEDTRLPEIRYEIAEAGPLNSASLVNRNEDRYFIGYPKAKFNWNAMCYTVRDGNRGSWKQVVAEVADLFEDTFEEEEDAGQAWAEQPTEQEYSLLDLVLAAQSKRQQKLSRKPHLASTETESRVNSASSQLVKKYGKGTAIVHETEKEDEDVLMDTATENFELIRDSASEADMTDDSGLQLSSGSADISMEVNNGSAVDYEQELSMSDKSFCTCGLPESELKVHYLQNMVGQAVEFGRCAPFTARFNMHAVSMALQQAVTNEQEGRLEEWWLLCQTADMTMVDSAGTTLDKQVRVKLKLYSSQKEEDVSAANGELQQLVEDKVSGQPVFMHLYTLLVSVSSILSNRWTSCTAPERKPQSDRTSSCVDTYLPFEVFTGKVEVCSMTQAYLQSVEKTTHQPTADQDMTVCRVPALLDDECMVCCARFDGSAASAYEFSSCVTLTTCGHSFCRRCWQHHLVASISEGHTTVLCMEYLCKTAVDTTTVMTLVPQRVYSRWQQQLISKKIMQSGQWKWCPSAHCGLLARRSGSSRGSKIGKGLGIPVVCLCSRKWCLDCGGDAHWPITCTQFNTYTKLLKQYGDDDGLKTTYYEISTVQVKRCPHCRYPMEKSGGCSHMVCSMCTTHFCWVCLAVWADHAIGAWSGCSESQEETVDLNNDKMHPLPMEYYKKAVSYRYVWKHLDKVHRKTVVAYNNYYANTLLELSCILLSNTPRKHQLAKPLRQDLQLLEFCSSRVNQYLEHPMRQVLQRSDALQRFIGCGLQQIHVTCRHAHQLVSRVQGTKAQDWLL